MHHDVTEGLFYIEREYHMEKTITLFLFTISTLSVNASEHCEKMVQRYLKHNPHIATIFRLAPRVEILGSQTRRGRELKEAAQDVCSPLKYERGASFHKLSGEQIEDAIRNLARSQFLHNCYLHKTGRGYKPRLGAIQRKDLPHCHAIINAWLNLYRPKGPKIGDIELHTDLHNPRYQ